MDGSIRRGPLDERPKSGKRALGIFNEAVSTINGTTPIVDVPRKIAGFLPILLSEPDLLMEEETLAPENAYSRNTIFECPKAKFSILAMVWSSQCETPIHDHPRWCTMGIYEGTIQEEEFCQKVAGEVELISQRTRREGEVSFLPSKSPNIHRISNVSAKKAITIHIYGGSTTKLGPNVGSIYRLST
jgi:predicted metal-dependent enzyme (double-stranded beta helix superfamily)